MTDTSGGRTAATGQDPFLTPADLALPGMDRLVAARTVTPPAPEVVARAQAVVRAAMEREARHTGSLEDAPGAAVPVRRRLFRRRWIASAAVVAAAATGIAVLPTVGIGGSKPPASASAATFLNDLADRTDAAARDGHGDATAIGRFHGAPYWKVSFDEFNSNSQQARTWNDRRAEYLSRIDGVRYDTLVDQPVNYDDMKAHVTPQPLAWSVGKQKVGVNGLDKLPTDTAALRSLLSAGQSAEHEWSDIDSLLGYAPISSKLRAALFRVLAQIPGVRLDGTHKDALGRSGTRISIDLGTTRSWYALIEPRTATLLADGSTGIDRVMGGTYHAGRTYTGAGPAWKLGR